MKIEIAESLFRSWLRHVRDCRLVQINWKPSPTWEGENLERIEELFKQSRGFFFQELNLDLYKKNSSLSQVMQQGEIDAIGICSGAGGRSSVVAVDVAFHEAGLNYGSKDITTARVLKKIMRTLFSLMAYFPTHDHEVVFAAPKIHNAVQSLLDDGMQKLNEFLQQHGVDAKCRLVSNEAFFELIVNPVCELSGPVSDTSELFMRSVQLMDMAPAPKSGSTNLTDSPSDAADSMVDPELAQRPRIGKAVQEFFGSVLDGDLLSPEELDRLCDKEYSRRTFGVHFPILVRSTDRQDGVDQFGNSRYYKRVYADEFLLCSQWFEKNYEGFLEWKSRAVG